MNGSDLNRRQFNKLTAAAFGGVVAGSIVGCGKTPAKKTGGNGSNGKNGGAADGKHACRGLNTCKDKGDSEKNDCAGQGSCSTVAAHDCGGKNECKYQGGCDGTQGANECKGKGGCHVPIKADKWQKARDAFEARMKKDGKTVGAAPAAAS